MYEWSQEAETKIGLGSLSGRLWDYLSDGSIGSLEPKASGSTSANPRTSQKSRTLRQQWYHV